MARKSYKLKGTLTSKKSRKSHKKKRSRKTSFASRVKKVVQRVAEHKTVGYKGSFSFGNYSATGLVANQLTPNSVSIPINQGVGQGDRIGNQIRIVKAVLRYVMVPAPYLAVYNPNPCPVLIREMFITNKSSPQSAPNVANFFQSGDGSFPPVGNLQDIVSTTNKDVNTIRGDKTMKLGFSQFNYTPGSMGSMGGYSNNDFPMNIIRKRDVTKYFPKKIVYQDATSTRTGPALYWTLLEAHADGGTSANWNADVSVQWDIELTYTDI